MEREMDIQDQQDRQHEQTRAQSSCINIKFEIISCEFATMTQRADRLIPVYDFSPVNACYFGKTRPDQDCRTCRHVRIIAEGAFDQHTEHRYHGYGAVFPITSEEAADAVMNVLETHDALPLRRPEWEADQEG